MTIPEPYWTDGQVTIHLGECLDVLPQLPPATVDAVVTDPPYGLEFMGREWDGADGFRRSLNPADAGRDNVFGRTSRSGPEYRTAGTGQRGKPGIGERPTDWVSNQGWNGFRCRTCGHLAHGGSPCTCETPDFVRADNRWPLFQEWCQVWATECLRILKPGGHMLAFGGTRTWHRLACAIEDAGFEIRENVGDLTDIDGPGLMWVYGEGFPKNRHVLKLAWEPIVVARKPLAGTVARNMAIYGTGTLNIAACKVPHASDADRAESEGKNRHGDFGSGPRQHQGVYAGQPAADRAQYDASDGRWPPNLLLGEGAAAEMDRQSGVTASRIGKPRASASPGDGWGMTRTGSGYADTGGASRFFPVFRYEAKVAMSERPRLDDGTTHPTVKPLPVVRWLVRLVTPPGGTVLDLFAGSGTTGEACIIEGFPCVLIEKDPKSVALIRKRLSKDIQPDLFGGGDAA